MKRLVVIALLALSFCQAAAQSWRVVDTSSSTYDTVQYSAPKINPIRYFGSPFCQHFANIKLLIGPQDFGIGAEYSYLPELWGFGLSGFVGYSNLWLAGGANYRLSRPWSHYDWHLYANGGIRCADGRMADVRPTLEAGIRMASAEGLGSFCYSSGSIGALTDFRHVYLTVGLSITLSTLFSFLILFP